MYKPTLTLDEKNIKYAKHMVCETFLCCNNIHNCSFSLEMCEFCMVSYVNKVIILDTLIEIQPFYTMLSFTNDLK